MAYTNTTQQLTAFIEAKLNQAMGETGTARATHIGHARAVGEAVQARAFDYIAKSELQNTWPTRQSILDQCDAKLTDAINATADAERTTHLKEVSDLSNIVVAQVLYASAQNYGAP